MFCVLEEEKPQDTPPESSQEREMEPQLREVNSTGLDHLREVESTECKVKGRKRRGAAETGTEVKRRHTGDDEKGMWNGFSWAKY